MCSAQFHSALFTIIYYIPGHQFKGHQVTSLVHIFSSKHLYAPVYKNLIAYNIYCSEKKSDLQIVSVLVSSYTVGSVFQGKWNILKI